MNKSANRATLGFRTFLSFAITAFLTLGASSNQAATATLTPTADAYVQNGANAAVNYGTATTLRIQASATAASNYESHLKFDTTSVSGVISNAKLRIYAKLTATGTITTSAYGVPTTTWGETTLTWNNKPAVGASLGSVVVNSTTFAYKDIDVTAYVQSEFSANRKVMSFAYRSGANTTPYITAYSKNSTSANKPQLVITYATNAAPTVSVSSPTAGASFTAPASVSLGANAADSDGTITKIEFYNGATLLNTDTLAPYSYNWTGVAPGAYSITAKATDNSGAVTTSGAVSVTVGAAANVPPSTTLTSPTIGATFTAPVSISLSANATDSDGTISKVEYYNGATLIATSTGPSPFAATWSNVAAGTYSLTAKATDNQGAATTSSPVSISVNPPNSLPTVSLTAPSNGATYNAPANMTLTADATDSDGSISKVEFYQGATLLGSIGSPPYTYSLNNMVVGSYSFTAKATDNQGATTTSSSISVIVQPSPNLTAPINYAYDELGRLVGAFDATGSAVTYRYDPVGNITKIERKSAGSVAIIEFTPDSAPISATVTITGVGFSATPSANTVSFNGTAATVNTATVNSLQVSVPAGATSGPISVTSPNGSAISASSFIVATSGSIPPTITSFTPTIGAAGTTITITGTGFQAAKTNNKVSINGIQLRITAVTNTSISAVIPSNIGSGKIKVTTPYGSALSTADYYYTPSPYVAGDVEIATRMNNPGSKAISIATPGKVAMVLFDGTAGQRVGLFLSDVTIPNSTVTIYRPDGLVYASVAVSTSGNSIGVAPLPMNGTYTILVAPASSGTGNMVLDLGGPDLAISGATVGTVVANQDGSFSFPVTFTVTNNGTVTAQPGWYDLAYLSIDGTLDSADFPINGYPVRGTALAPGASYVVSTTYSTGPTATPGSYTLIVKTDGHSPNYTGGTITDNGNVVEANETNNVASLPVTLARSDLTVSNLTLGTVVANQDGSFSFPVTFTVTNNGTVTAQPGWYDLAYLSIDGTLDSADFPINGYPVRGTALAPGASYVVSTTYSTGPTATPGSYTLIVKTDGHSPNYTGGTITDNGNVVEANETNNVASLPVTLARS